MKKGDAMQFAPSLMCMDFLRIERQLDILNARADYYHVDIMDGHYCKNMAFSPDFIASVSKAATLPMDVHLMTTNPGDWLEPVAKAGAAFISPHAETINVDAFRVLNRIEALGCKPGVVLNPATGLESVRHYLSRLEMLTIMTVDVGYAGQPFIPEMLDKIREAKRLKEQNGYKYRIQIDGQANRKTFRPLSEAGAEILIVGASGLFSLDGDLNVAYDKMLAHFDGERNGVEPMAVSMKNK